MSKNRDIIAKIMGYISKNYAIYVQKLKDIFGKTIGCIWYKNYGIYWPKTIGYIMGCIWQNPWDIIRENWDIFVKTMRYSENNGIFLANTMEILT